MNRFQYTIKNAENKRIVKLTIRVQMRDSTGIFKITDIMLQGGYMASQWQPHPSEIRWSMNE